MFGGVIIDNNISPVLILRSFRVSLKATGNTPVNQTTLAPTSESTMVENCCHSIANVSCHQHFLRDDI